MARASLPAAAQSAGASVIDILFHSTNIHKTFILGRLGSGYWIRTEWNWPKRVYVV
jgi:hypothetical protein